MQPGPGLGPGRVCNVCKTWCNPQDARTGQPAHGSWRACDLTTDSVQPSSSSRRDAIYDELGARVLPPYAGWSVLTECLAAPSLDEERTGRQLLQGAIPGSEQGKRCRPQILGLGWLSAGPGTR